MKLLPCIIHCANENSYIFHYLCCLHARVMYFLTRINSALSIPCDTNCWPFKITQVDHTQQNTSQISVIVTWAPAVVALVWSKIGHDSQKVQGKIQVLGLFSETPKPIHEWMFQQRVFSVWLLLEFCTIRNSKFKAFIGKHSADSCLSLAQNNSAFKSCRYCETLKKIQNFSGIFEQFCLSLMGIPSALYRMGSHLLPGLESLSSGQMKCCCPHQCGKTALWVVAW